MKLKKLLKVISSSPNSETLVEIFNEKECIMHLDGINKMLNADYKLDPFYNENGDRLFALKESDDADNMIIRVGTIDELDTALAITNHILSSHIDALEV